LNRIESITTKELYDKSLALFNIEIRKAGRGHVVFVTDGNGNPVRYPMRLSDFKERPRFYLSAKLENVLQQSNQGIDKFQVAQWARDLNRLVEMNKKSDYGKNHKLNKKVYGKRKLKF
jgi:hypothetical protein